MSRQYCKQCAYPASTCVCEAIESIILPFRVIILQHEKESKHAKNTARLAKLVSPGIEIVRLCNQFNINELADSIDRPNAIVLYPNDTSVTLEDYKMGIKESEASNPYSLQRVTLILIDASWRQAYGIWQQHTWLKDLVHCHLGEVPSKQYMIRKSKKPYQLSTIEALAHSVEILSGISGQPYLHIFTYMQRYWADYKK